MTVDLGVFTPAELRAGGINSRGFVQPLLPPSQGVDPGPANREAAEGLASRGLLRRSPSGWRAVGRYERVLEAAAVARSLVGIGVADPGAPGFSTPRLALGCLGVTPWVLDLCPEPTGYHARLLEPPAAAVELAGYVEVLADQTSWLARAEPGGRAGLPDASDVARRREDGAAALVSAGGSAGAPREAGASPEAGALADTGAARTVAGKPAVSEVASDWDEAEKLLKRGVATVRIEAASITRPAGPLLQHRLTLVSTDGGDWLLIGIRAGERADRRVAPIAGVRMGPALESLLGGSALAF